MSTKIQSKLFFTLVHDLTKAHTMPMQQAHKFKRDVVRHYSVLGPLAVLVVASLVEVLLTVPAHQAVLEDGRAALPALLRIRSAIMARAFSVENMM